MTIKRLTAAVLTAHALLFASGAWAGEYVTKEEFNSFLERLAKNEAENAALKKKNAELAEQVQALQAERKDTALESKIDTFLTSAEVAEKRNHNVDVQSKSGTTKFLMAGWADSGFEDRKGAPSTFTAQFHPVFLWKLDERLSFESDLQYYVINYHFDDLATLGAGKFLTPFGAFIRRQQQSWSNKAPDAPLALSASGGLVSAYSVGAMVSGGFEGPCETRFNYAAYVSNGPRLSANNPATFGTLDFNNDTDNNKSKAFGGRMGILPTLDLEFGASFQASRVGLNGTPQSGTDALLLGADASYIHDFDLLRGTVDLKAEWFWSRVDAAVYQFGGDNFYFSDNHRNGGYAQAAYRPTKVNQKWVQNLEWVFRYDRLDNPDQAPVVPGADRRQFADHDRATFGMNYWLGPTAVLKFAYERDRNKERAILLQFALGF